MVESPEQERDPEQEPPADLPGQPSTWVAIAATRKPDEAYLIKGILEENGIEVSLDNEAMNNVMAGLLLDGVNVMTLYVPEAMAEEARKVLEENRDRPGLEEGDLPDETGGPG